MKKMKKISNILLLALVATGLSSCLKDKYNALGPDNSPSVVEFKNPGTISSVSPAGALYSMYPQSFPAQASVDATYTVQLTGPNPAGQDITVTVGVDTAAVRKFNADQRIKNPTFVGYDLPDASTYTFPQTSYVIKAGQRSVDIVVSYKSEKFDFKKKYAFPLAITSTSAATVSGNFGTILINLSAKNAWDGVYNYKTSATTALRPNLNETARLVTSGANTVTTPLVNYYTAASNELTYEIDPATNKVKVLNGGIGDPVVDPSSNWDPVKKILYVKWSAGSRSFEETYTYTGPR